MHKKKYLGLQELGDASPSLGSIIDDLSAAYHLSLDYQNNYIDFIMAIVKQSNKQMTLMNSSFYSVHNYGMRLKG